MDSKENETVNENPQEEVKNETSQTNLPLDDKAKIVDLEIKLAEANDRFVRLYSEFDNFKKRTLKERIDLIRSAGEDVFKIILPLLDDLERAIKANQTAVDLKAVNEGVALIHSKLLNTLTSNGLEEMKAVGEEFNPDLHEAITNVPSEEQKGKVIEVIEKGYLLGGKVIRYAKVIVGA